MMTRFREASAGTLNATTAAARAHALLSCVRSECSQSWSIPAFGPCEDEAAFEERLRKIAKAVPEPKKFYWKRERPKG
jgi:hypothetical protein